MSIRLGSGGHSLSAPTIAEIFTRRSIIAPTLSLLSDDMALEALAELAILPDEGERVYIINGGEVSVALLLKGAMVNEEWSLSSPLLADIPGSGLRLLADMHQGFLMVKMVDDDGLIIADTYHAAGVADMLYWTTMIASTQSGEPTLYIKGEAAAEHKVIKQYFKRVVICE